jgi:secreted trypsin-like serine protease
MRKVLIGSLLAFTVWTAAPASAITFGELDHHRHPNVGSLIYRSKNGRWHQWCSGSLVSPTVVMTAAHCVIDEPPQRFWVTFDPSIDDDATAYHGTAAYDPRAYTTGESHPYDIAVIVLDHAVTGITPVELPTEGLLSDLEATHDLRNQTFTAVGYGTVRTSKQGGPAGILNNRKRRFVEQSASSLQDQWVQFSMNPSTGNGGTCYGDSGGPHFLGGPDSNLVVALTVTGDAVCKATDKDYRIDTPEAREFLADYVTLP